MNADGMNNTLRKEIESLIKTMAETYKNEIGLAYTFAKFEKEIVRELLLEGMSARAINERWRIALAKRETGRVKGLKLLMLQEKTNDAAPQAAQSDGRQSKRQAVPAVPMSAKLKAAMLAINDVIQELEAR